MYRKPDGMVPNSPILSRSQISIRYPLYLLNNRVWMPKYTSKASGLRSYFFRAYRKPHLKNPHTANHRPRWSHSTSQNYVGSFILHIIKTSNFYGHKVEYLNLFFKIAANFSKLPFSNIPISFHMLCLSCKYNINISFLIG